METRPCDCSPQGKCRLAEGSSLLLSLYPSREAKHTTGFQESPARVQCSPQRLQNTPCQSGCGTLATQPSASYPFPVTTQPCIRPGNPLDARTPPSGNQGRFGHPPNRKFTLVSLFFLSLEDMGNRGHLPSHHNYFLLTPGQPNCHWALLSLNPPPLPHPFHHPNCPLDNMLGCGILGFSERWLATQSPF